jgi:hypothetical protein
VLRDEVPGVGECERRVTHAALNKDRGLIDLDTGKATGPTTPRGMVGDNFAKAVSGAITETRRQWQDFRSELTAQSCRNCSFRSRYDSTSNEASPRTAEVVVGLAGDVAVG